MSEKTITAKQAANAVTAANAAKHVEEFRSRNLIGILREKLFVEITERSRVGDTHISQSVAYELTVIEDLTAKPSTHLLMLLEEFNKLGYETSFQSVQDCGQFVNIYGKVTISWAHAVREAPQPKKGAKKP